MPRYQLTSGLVVLAAALYACAKEVPVVEVMGECADMYQAEICTWARMQGTTVVAVGATVPLASIENAPDDVEMTWPPVMASVLRMPESSQQQAGLTDAALRLPFLHDFTGGPDRHRLHRRDQAVGTSRRIPFAGRDVAPRHGRDGRCEHPHRPVRFGNGHALSVDLRVGEYRHVSRKHGPRLLPRQADLHRTHGHARATAGEALVRSPYPQYPRDGRGISPGLPCGVRPSIPGMAGGYPRAFHAEYDAEQELYHFVFSDFAPGA